MVISSTIPCVLRKPELTIVFRDLCRHINYLSPLPNREIAQVTSSGATSGRWIGAPESVNRVELGKNDDRLLLSLETIREVDPTDAQSLFNNLAGHLSSYFNYQVRPFSRRVFHIGWAKTGTTSITEAMRILGLFSWQFAPWVSSFNHFQTKAQPITYDFDCIEHYRFLSDLPFSLAYKQLDEAFPGSLFIYTTRDKNSWLRSAIVEVQKHIETSGCVHGVESWAYGSDVVDADHFLCRYLEHKEEVLSYFSGRPDFLSIDLTKGNPWQCFASF